MKFLNNVGLRAFSKVETSKRFFCLIFSDFPEPLLRAYAGAQAFPQDPSAQNVPRQNASFLDLCIRPFSGSDFPSGRQIYGLNSTFLGG